MLDSIKALSAVRQSCISDTPIPREIQLWLAGSLGRFLDQTTRDLDDAFGLSAGRGGIPWWMERGIRKRDQALRTLAQTFLHDQPISGQARNIALLSKRFASCNWPRDARNDRMPGHYQGNYREFLWKAFRSGARMPLSERHIRNVLKELPASNSRTNDRDMPGCQRRALAESRDRERA